MQNLYEILARSKHRTSIAVIHAGRRWTYAELYARVEDLDLDATWGADDWPNIGLLLPNSLEYVVAYFAVLCAGKVVVPINPNSTVEEIERDIALCRITTLFVNRETLAKVRDVAGLSRLILAEFRDEPTSELAADARLIYPTACTPGAACTRPPAGYLARCLDDAAILLHTSGTTSEPKKVILTHANLLSNLTAHVEALGLTREDNALIGLPMFFSYSNTSQLLAHLYLQGTLVIMESFFMPANFLRTVEAERISVFTAVPSMLVMLLQFPLRSQYDTSSLRYLCFGGASLSAETIRLVMARFPGTEILQTYGLTEASPRVTILLGRDSLRKIGSVGQSLPGVEVRVVDELGTEVYPGVVGEIVVRGGNVMKGYYRRDSVTTEPIRDGWLHTGDLGFLDDEGYLFLKGRIKNIIISGGLNLYPEEIEERLLTHPRVRNATVMSKPDPVLGEVPVAYVVVDEPVPENELMAYCANTLSANKIPREIHFTDEIPQTCTGKNVRKRR